MKKIIKEFRDFISRGNVLDMAVGLIIGSAFTAIVSAVVGDLLTPLIGFILPSGNFGNLNGVGPGFNFGNIINAIITLLLTALCLFIIIKGINSLKSIGKKKVEEEAKEPTTKECPYCISEISIKAIRCPNCTTKLEGFEDFKPEEIEK